jgi:hypothetical protein
VVGDLWGIARRVSAVLRVRGVGWLRGRMRWARHCGCVEERIVRLGSRGWHAGRMVQVLSVEWE